MDFFIYWVGWTVCVTGGVLIAVAFVAFVISYTWERATSTRALMRILSYARREGLNLATGEPFDENEAA